VGDILLFLSERVDQLRQQGAGDLMIDPGVGFGKNASTTILPSPENSTGFRFWSYPYMAGVSRNP
jgi:dihydropteroate synthase